MRPTNVVRVTYTCIQTLKRINDVNPSGKHTLATDKTEKQFFFLGCCCCCSSNEWQSERRREWMKMHGLWSRMFFFFFSFHERLSRTHEGGTHTIISAWYGVWTYCCATDRPTDSYDNFKKGPVYLF